MDVVTLTSVAAASLAAVPAAYVAASQRVGKAIQNRLEKISGGKVGSLEELVAAAVREKRTRQIPISVYGDAEHLWRLARQAGYENSNLGNHKDGKVAIVDADSVDVNVIRNLNEPYCLIYKQGRYEGPMPPGGPGFCTFANNHITTVARLNELAAFVEAKRPRI